MPFQLRELAIPVVGDSSQGAWPELGSTCRKGGSTCVAREAGDSKGLEVRRARAGAAASPGERDHGIR